MIDITDDFRIVFSDPPPELLERLPRLDVELLQRVEGLLIIEAARLPQSLWDALNAPNQPRSKHERQRISYRRRPRQGAACCR